MWTMADVHHNENILISHHAEVNFQASVRNSFVRIQLWMFVT